MEKGMKKVILAPDSFKGTMSAEKVCEIMSRCVRRIHPDCEIVEIPVADGGEGSVDCFLRAAGGVRVPMRVTGPLGDCVDSFFGILQENGRAEAGAPARPGGTAVIEMAACAGLPLAGDGKNPEKATTFGVGELIGRALEMGCRKIILGLGGSATNDGGCGMAAALGVRFWNQAGETFLPVGGTLGQISHIDVSGLLPAISECEFTAMCDIDNPLYGPQGAAYIFGPQKGADEEMVQRLDAGLRHLARIIRQDLGLDVAQLPGAGAAGGMGAGAAVFLRASLKPGIETVLDSVDFERSLEGADAVFTGEGRLDAQSLMGKVVGGIARHAKKRNVPLIVIAGSIEDPIEALYDAGVTAAVSINRRTLPFQEAVKYSGKNLEWTMENVLRLMRL